jgi:hypothetical protein
LIAYCELLQKFSCCSNVCGQKHRSCLAYFSIQSCSGTSVQLFIGFISL